MPRDGVAIQAINAEALASGRCGVLAPKVVVNGIRSSLDGVPLTTGVGALLNWCWRRGGQRNERGRGDGGGVLHSDELIAVVSVEMGL